VKPAGLELRTNGKIKNQEADCSVSKRCPLNSSASQRFVSGQACHGRRFGDWNVKVRFQGTAASLRTPWVGSSTKSTIGFGGAAKLGERSRAQRLSNVNAPCASAGGTSLRSARKRRRASRWTSFACLGRLRWRRSSARESVKRVAPLGRMCTSDSRLSSLGHLMSTHRQKGPQGS